MYVFLDKVSNFVEKDIIYFYLSRIKLFSVTVEILEWYPVEGTCGFI